MTKKKKKTALQLQQEQRERANSYRKEFFDNLAAAFAKHGQPSVLNEIPLYIHDVLYKLRSNKPIFELANGKPLSEWEKRNMEWCFESIMVLPIHIEGIPSDLTFKEYFMYIFGVTVALKQWDIYNPIPYDVKKRMEFLSIYNDSLNVDIIGKFALFAESFPDMLSSADTGYLKINSLSVFNKKESRMQGKMMPVLGFCMKYDKVDPIKKVVTINGNYREVYRLGYLETTSTLKWLNIDGYAVNRDDMNEIPIYIQRHAIIRCHERLDRIIALLNNYFLAESVAQCKQPIRDKKDIWLIPYYTMGAKVGYLVGTVVNDMFVITTFLFITNTGTPEGTKLDKLTGLNKIDKAFLSIDTLGTFIDYNLGTNKTLYDLLSRAGLSHLCNLSQNRYFFKMDKDDEQKQLAYFQNYLKGGE